MGTDPNGLISLTGRVALVTGASRGIGRAIAQRLARAGATVIVTARSLDQPASSHRDQGTVTLAGTLAETVQLIEAAGGQAIALACDLEDPAQRAGLVPAALARAGRIDILVNNAGFADYTQVADMSDDIYARTVDHYLTIPFMLSRAVIPVMRSQGGGWILNLGSVSAEPPVRPFSPMEADSGSAVYAAAKAAITRLTQGMAVELQRDNIAVNLVAPSGAIQTPGASGLIPEGYECEPIDYIASAALDLVHRPASEWTGIVAYSVHYCRHHDLPAISLATGALLPPAPLGAWSHPDINPAGH